jgi:hypothetical protein
MVDEPEQVPPWREGDGPPPTMWVWPGGHQPALKVRVDGRWVTAVVEARADYPDGRVAYHVDITFPEPSSGGTHRAYWWPQDGLRVAWRSSVEPERTK